MIFSWVLVMKTAVESSANRSAESIEGSSYNNLLTLNISRYIKYFKTAETRGAKYPKTF